MGEPRAPTTERKHRSAMRLAIEQMLSEHGLLHRAEPQQLDLFLAPGEVTAVKRRRGRPRTARVPRKYRRR